MRIIPVAIVVVLAVVMTGCAADVDRAAEPTPEPTSSPTVEPVVDEPAGPHIVFDGNCSSLADDAGITADLGQAMTMQPPDAVSVPYLAIPQLGGLYCRWEGATPEGPYVGVTVFPSSSFAEPEANGTRCEAIRYCNFDGVVNGLQIFGNVQKPTDDPQISAVAEAIRARMLASLATAQVPPRYSPVDPWPATVACEKLDTTRSIATTIGDPAAVGYPYGGDAEPNRGFYAALIASGQTNCTWYGAVTGPSLEVQILPGGGWVGARLAVTAGAVPQSVAGFDESYLVGDSFFGISGSNVIEMRLAPEGADLTISDFYPAATALVADLNAL